MSVSLRDRKMLWVRSGNLCAFPGCFQLLVEPQTRDQPGVMIGEEAHIVAQKPTGARGDFREQAEIDSYSNLILLCPTHHRIIDEQPLIYTVTAVQDMKRLHEEYVRARSLPLNPLVSLDLSGIKPVWEDCVPVNAWRIGQTIVVVCSFGSMPVMSPNGRWRGAGLQFHQLNSAEVNKRLLSSSEAEPDIEYWVSETFLYIVQQTYDHEAGGFVPFVEHRFDMTRFPAGHSLEVLLRYPTPDSLTLSDIEEALASVDRGDGEIAEVLFLKLRNAGTRSPSKALRILNRFKGMSWYDGATAETGSMVERELKLVEAVRGVT
jgi:hypothetical protein